ncbi:MAG: hypothetical protein ACLTV6_15290 [Christensenellales bacterium]
MPPRRWRFRSRRRAAALIADHDKREGLELAETFAALGLRSTPRQARRTCSTTTAAAQPVPRPGEDTDELAKLFDSAKSI